MSIEKKTFHSGPFKSIFAQGVQTGNRLYLAGQVGIDANGKAGADIVEQTRLAYINIQQVLAEFGAKMDNIVDETVFVTDMNEIMSASEAVFAARANAYGGVPEVCQTLLQVSALVTPELKLEIKCIAEL